MRGSELPVASLGLRPGTYSVPDGRDEKQKNPPRLNQVWIVWVLLLIVIVTMEMDGPLFFISLVAPVATNVWAFLMLSGCYSTRKEKEANMASIEVQDKTDRCHQLQSDSKEP
ncbi:hypothetical protein M440DRAFT_1171615 [Trichoderma longibrachiatum ATCC 18648]|uniref:Uncharacterized protein n=1 Tax=Trichoderma longibrachiatum ATCC 18648 TaxID=983965 RepID=A0A2T4CD93_TRILO|nr:hypothetical protein M440DRAFT_1171615 [Trichoderma longibrachiatum ATCC 18648]